MKVYIRTVRMQKYFLVPDVSTVRYIFEVRHVQILNVAYRTAILAVPTHKRRGHNYLLRINHKKFFSEKFCVKNLCMPNPSD